MSAVDKQSAPPVFENITEAIGNTPLIRIRNLADPKGAKLYAKIEMLNPGGSVKDRIGASMLDAAEASGELKPGGTVVECTSGNTGVGLALNCAVRGYKLICTMPDKMSKEKIDLLRAMGAEVIVTPSNVAADHPDSYYSVARRIAESTDNCVWTNQYFNDANPEAHYKSTGPEIWAQTEGKLAAFVAGMGTCGTISGIGSRAGTRCFARRRRLSLSRQYTRQTRLWFQRWPWRRKRRNSFQKPRPGFLSASALNVSASCRSRSSQSTSGLYQADRDSPMLSQAR